MSRKKTLLTISVTLICAFVFIFSGCSKEDEIRKYKEPVIKKKHKASSAPKNDPLKIPVWAIPGNWKIVESKSSIRLGTYKTPLDSICSIVMIPGKAGTLEANIARWLKQLKQKESEKNIKTILANSEEFSTIGRLNGRILDFTCLPGSEGVSYLISIIDAGKHRMFIKLKGSTGALKKEKSDLITFSQSVQYEK